MHEHPDNCMQAIRLRWKLWKVMRKISATETLHFMFFENGLRPLHVARVDQDGVGGGYR